MILNFLRGPTAFLETLRLLYLNFFPWAMDIFKFSMFIQGLTFIIFAKLSKPYVYSRPYVYYFCQNFQALRLFPALATSILASRVILWILGQFDSHIEFE